MRWLTVDIDIHTFFALMIRRLYQDRSPDSKSKEWALAIHKFAEQKTGVRESEQGTTRHA
ncbi:MAG: hypothetical protein KGM95_09805 [Betaproteobacteria bacterium]|nr:hypothetical protein [Betaproteobacteria bacterium]